MAPLLTPSDVAARFGCSVRTVNRMAQTRVLPALKRGRHWRFSLDAVAAYEAANTTVSTAPAPIRSAAPQPVPTALPEGGRVLGERWWESRQNNAASPAAARGRATTKRGSR